MAAVTPDAVPAAHSRQALMDAEPAAGLYVPGRQAVQLPDVAVLQYPAVHWVHVATLPGLK